MKLKHKITLASVLIGLALQAQAQTSVLVAGWDFNGFSAAQVLGANYTDNYNGSNPLAYDGVSRADGAGLAQTRGSFLANGTFGTEAITVSGAQLTSTTSADLVNRPITSRTGESPFNGSEFDNAYLGTSDQALQIGTSVASGTQTFGFQVDTTGVNLQSASLFLSRSAVTSLTNVDWSYQVGNGPAISLGQVSAVTAAAGAYNEFTLNLVAAALDNVGLVTLIGQLSPATSSYALRLDNVGVYGNLSLASIPEPSTYAAILGAMALGVAALRRRRADVVV